MIPLQSRYDRQLLIPDWDQNALARARVLIAGAGAIGGEVIKLLALLGVGELHIVDFDRVESSNLSRSALFRDADLGQPKALVAAARARELNPELKTVAYNQHLELGLGAGVYRAMNLVIACLDSVDARLSINRICMRHHIPWINGGTEHFCGEAALYGFTDSPCYECSLTDEMWAARARRYSCAGLLTDDEEPPSPSTIITTSLAAAYMVQIAVDQLQNRGMEGAVQPGEKLFFQVNPPLLLHQKQQLSPACTAHEIWEPVEVWKEGVAQLTIRNVLERAGDPEMVLEPGFELMTGMVCSRCGEQETRIMPVEAARESLVYCQRCREKTRRPVTLSSIGRQDPIVDCTLAQIGVPPYGVVSLWNGHERRVIQLDGEYGGEP